MSAGSYVYAHMSSQTHGSRVAHPLLYIGCNSLHRCRRPAASIIRPWTQLNSIKSPTWTFVQKLDSCIHLLLEDTRLEWPLCLLRWSGITILLHRYYSCHGTVLWMGNMIGRSTTINLLFNKRFFFPCIYRLDLTAVKFLGCKCFRVVNTATYLRALRNPAGFLSAK
jgi:hypothetical protein